MPSHRRQAAIARDLLIPDILYKWAKEYRRGLLRDRQRIQLDPPHMAGDVRALIASNFDWKVLHDLLFNHSRLIGHPVVWTLVSYLLHCVGRDPIISDTATKTLHSVLQGWLSGLLPGLQLHLPKRRGPKLDPWTEYWHENVLFLYEQTLRAFKNDKWYSQADVVEAIKRVWSGKNVNEGLGSVPYLRNEGSKRVWRSKKVPFPKAQMSIMAQQTLNRGSGFEMRTFLAYHLVARRYKLTYNQVRHIVEHTRRERDNRKRRRKSRSKPALPPTTPTSPLPIITEI